MKGIIMAGGTGTRLYPITKSISKQMLPIYDKPMIYYPLSVLMLGGIRDILIISTSRDLPVFRDLLGDGAQLGLNIEYRLQKEPKGLAESFLIGETFLDGGPACLILGDNIFHGTGLVSAVERARDNINGATIFGYYVKNPRNYGVVELDNQFRIIGLAEKPDHPRSNYAIPGLYFYDSDVVEFARQVNPSKRGELEITSINQMYFERGTLHVEIFGRGIAWMDTGTNRGLLDAANYVQTIQNIQGLYVACIEEIALRKGYIDIKQLQKLAAPLAKSDYGAYLMRIIETN